MYVHFLFFSSYVPKKSINKNIDTLEVKILTMIASRAICAGHPASYTYDTTLWYDLNNALYHVIIL
jgi:hypothetical protein